MIRVVHTLGGCGGTLLSRCLGVLPGVALLSEINPFSVKLFPHFDPLHQDRNWLHLLEAADLEKFSRMNLGAFDAFRDLLCTFHDRAEKLGRHLVLRDYNYVDFIGVPYIENPPRKRTMCRALPEGAPVSAIAFIRHPVDQWFSLRKHEHVKAVLTPAIFLGGYVAFLQDLGGIPVFRYEDFVRDPHAELGKMCRELDLEFDPEFEQRFFGYDHVTGDFSRHHERKISLSERKAVPEAVLEEFCSNPHFQTVLWLTGYPKDTCERPSGPNS
jgi:hypothetical protein